MDITISYNHNALGSVVALSDENGAIVERYEYSAFGLVTIRDAAGSVIKATAHGNRFLYTGREYFQGVNLYDYRNRVYSPSLGRFLQTDPIRFNAGDVNWYRYVGNSPVNFTDPEGLESYSNNSGANQGGQNSGAGPSSSGSSSSGQSSSPGGASGGDKPAPFPTDLPQTEDFDPSKLGIPFACIGVGCCKEDCKKCCDRSYYSCVGGAAAACASDPGIKAKLACVAAAELACSLAKVACDVSCAICK